MAAIPMKMKFFYRTQHSPTNHYTFVWVGVVALAGLLWQPALRCWWWWFWWRWCWCTSCSDDVVVLVVDLLGSQLDLSGSGSHPSGSARHKIYILPNIFCQKILFVAEFLLPIFAQFSCHWVSFPLVYFCPIFAHWVFFCNIFCHGGIYKDFCWQKMTLLTIWWNEMEEAAETD